MMKHTLIYIIIIFFLSATSALSIGIDEIDGENGPIASDSIYDLNLLFNDSIANVLYNNTVYQLEQFDDDTNLPVYKDTFQFKRAVILNPTLESVLHTIADNYCLTYNDTSRTAPIVLLTFGKRHDYELPCIEVECTTYSIYYDTYSLIIIDDVYFFLTIPENLYNEHYKNYIKITETTITKSLNFLSKHDFRSITPLKRFADYYIYLFNERDIKLTIPINIE